MGHSFSQDLSSACHVPGPLPSGADIFIPDSQSKKQPREGEDVTLGRTAAQVVYEAPTRRS